MTASDLLKIRRLLVTEPFASHKALYLAARAELHPGARTSETELAWRTARYCVAFPLGLILCNTVEYLLRNVARRKVGDIDPTAVRQGPIGAIILKQAMEMVWIEDLQAFERQTEDLKHLNLRVIRWCFLHIYRILCFIGLPKKADILLKYWSLCENHMRVSAETVIYSSTFFDQIGHSVVFYALRCAEEQGFLERSSPLIDRPPSPHNAFLSEKAMAGLSLLTPGETRSATSVYAHPVYNPVPCTLSNGETVSGTHLISRFIDAHFQDTDAPLITIDKSTRDRAHAELRTIGIDPSRRIVTLHVRESGYERGAPIATTGPRNAQIDAYVPAIRTLIARGYQVVRLGDTMMRPLEPFDGFFDYPFSPIRSDYLDIVLTSLCDFHIGTSSGMSHVPLLFDRPVLYTNWMPYGGFIHSRRTLTLTKALYERCGRRIPPHEANARFRNCYDATFFELLDIAVVDNTSDEIVAATEIMIADSARTIDRNSPLKIRLVSPPERPGAKAI